MSALGVASRLPLALPALLPLLAVLTGTRSLREIALDFGPGDGPYTRGFAFPNPESVDPYEIADGVATHWTSHDATVELPLEVRAPAALLTLRFARHFADRGHVDVGLAGCEAGRLDVRKGFQEYRLTTALPGATPLRLDLHVEAKDDRNLGLSLDWVRVSLPAGSRVRLTGASRWRAPATVAIVTGLLLLLGFSPRATLALAGLLGGTAALGLLLEPWLVHRLLTGLPEGLALFGAAGVVLSEWAKARGAAPADIRFAGGLVLLVFLVRAHLLNHPAFYYPDFVIHTRIAKLMHRAGIAETLLAPAAFLGSFQGARSSVVGMPYGLFFHAPFALLDWPFDQTLSSFKVFGAVISTLPIGVGFALARQLELPARLVALLLALAPTFPHWLFRGTLPALLGHGIDLVLLLWLARHLPALTLPRTFGAGALLVATAHLNYSFSIPLTGLLVVFLALVAPGEPGPDRLRFAAAVLAVGAVGALLSFALYYRGFLEGTLALVAAAPAAQTASGPGFLGRLAEVLRTGLGRFFDTLWPLLALLGIPLARVRAPRAGRAVLTASLLTWLALALLRAAVPHVFRWNHDVLLLTSLLALLAGASLARLHAGGRTRRLLAVLALLTLVTQCLAFTTSSFGALLGNVR